MKNLKKHSIYKIEFEGNINTNIQQEEEFLNRLILEFFSPGVWSVGKCSRALDVYRKSLLKNHHGGGDEIIWFKKSKSCSLEDVSLNDMMRYRGRPTEHAGAIIIDYCRNEWRANLIHTYFRSPWALISLIAAIFLFGLTIVHSYHK
ncbi:hypothetical protein L6164_010810 [Bauhinia variegata]|uniref:Uncharacterized protein n=1 Tax=Bauhinia variegata TaxID=167791 RepID=A0ACB9P548_BAUVA|nr:hypothetical protein L6164_010810 [Bauhinia variegata]